MALQFVGIAFLSSLTVAARNYAEDSLISISIAKGYTVEMGKIIQANQSDQNSIQIGHFLIRMATLGLVASAVPQVACYIAIIRYLNQNDKKVKACLSQTTISNRRKRNVVTLTGQVICFGITLSTLVFVNSILAWKIPGFDESVYSLTFVASSAAMSIVPFLTSPELRRHYFDKA